MNLSFQYAALLSLFLVDMFVGGNPHDSNLMGGSTLSVFPHLLMVFSIPVAIAILILHVSQQTGAKFTWQKSIRSGELASRWAATIFAFAVVMYGLGFYAGRSHPSAHTLVFWGGNAFVMTYLVGVASAALAAIAAVVRMRRVAADS